MISFGEDDPDLLARALIFLYTSQYPDSDISNATSQVAHGQFTALNDAYKISPDSYSTKCRLHAAMYSIADKYRIATLKTWRRRCFARAWLDRDDEKAQSTSLTAEDAANYLAVVPFVYDSTPASDRGIRNIVVLGAQFDFQRRHGLAQNAMQHLIKTTPDFAFDLISLPLERGFRRCRSCCAQEAVQLSTYNTCGLQDCQYTRCSGVDREGLECLKCFSVGQMAKQEGSRITLDRFGDEGV